MQQTYTTPVMAKEYNGDFLSVTSPFTGKTIWFEQVDLKGIARQVFDRAIALKDTPFVWWTSPMGLTSSTHVLELTKDELKALHDIYVESRRTTRKLIKSYRNY